VRKADAAVRTIAAQVCTAAELEAWAMEDRGLSQRAIAHHLGISRAAVRDRLNNAARKIARALNDTEGT